MTLVKYTAPDMEITYLETQDILTTSGDIGGGTVIPDPDEWEDQINILFAIRDLVLYKARQMPYRRLPCFYVNI